MMQLPPFAAGFQCRVAILLILLLAPCAGSPADASPAGDVVPAGLASAPATSSEADTARAANERRVERANAALQAGRPQAAIDGYREALDLDSDYLPARVNLAMLYSRQGETERSQALLREGLANADTPRRDRGHLAYLLALSLAEQGEYEMALDWLARDAEWRPEHARTFYNQALLLDRLGRQAAALDALYRGLRLTPESPDLLYAAVYLNATQGHVSEALAAMEALRRVAPDDPQLGRLERQLKGRAAP